MISGMVSCIIASYNTEGKYLLESVNSILNQTYSNLEVIVVDDGSEVSVKTILSHIKDERIVVLENGENLGVTYSRNLALSYAKGEYMAVMDADDVSEVTRFEKEVKFLVNNPDYDLVSCQMKFIATDGRADPFLEIPKSSDKFLARLFWDNSRPFPHGPAMIRMNFLKKNHILYDEHYKKALDYRLWVDCARCRGKFFIINEYLYFYRIHENQISTKKRKDQIYYADMICLDQLNYLKIVPTEDNKMIHLYLRDSECWSIPEDTFAWKNRLIKANRDNLYCSATDFENEVNYRFFKMCFKEFILRKNYRFAKWFISSLSLYNVMISIKAITIPLLSRNHPRTLKV